MTIAGRDIGSQHDVVKIVDYVAIVLLGLSMKLVHRSRQDDGLCAGVGFHGIKVISRKYSKHAVIAAVVNGLHHCATSGTPLAGKVEKLLPAMQVHQTSDVIEQHKWQPNDASL